MLNALQLIERALLFVIVLMTIAAVAFEAVSVFEAREVLLADILLMFLHLEIIGMIVVYYIMLGETPYLSIPYSSQ